MAGINRLTGKPLGGIDHVKQSLQVVFTTRLRSRIMRRMFGSDIPALLGMTLTKSNILKYSAAVILAVELWEPRYKITRVSFDQSVNTESKIRLGALAMKIEGYYLPNALSGDFTPDTSSPSSLIF
jgi:uncharacterized protein